MSAALLTYINFASVKLFVRVQNVFTISKLLACLIIVIGGLYKLCAGELSTHDWTYCRNRQTNTENVTRVLTNLIL